MCSSCLLIIFKFVRHACFYLFERESVYFLDPTGISNTNLLKHLLYVISITQLVDQCKSCILIGYATIGLLVIVIE